MKDKDMETVIGEVFKELFGADNVKVVRMEPKEGPGPARDEDAAEGREWCEVCQEYHPIEPEAKVEADKAAQQAKALKRVDEMLEENKVYAQTLTDLRNSIATPLGKRSMFHMIREIALIRKLDHLTGH